MSNTFMDQKRNDNFHFLRRVDLQNLLLETNHLFLEYRDTLNLPNDVTFRTEIEYEGILESVVDDFIAKNLKDWKSEFGNLLGSCEKINSPVMSDEIKYWNELKKVCKYLFKNKADTTHNASGHIHIDANVLGNDVEAWKIFLKLYTAYENVLFRFTYGDKINGRKMILKYAPPTSDLIYSKLNNINNASSLEDIAKNLQTDLIYTALSFYNVSFYCSEFAHKKNTLEFRSPNATTNEVIWQNNINALTKMLLSSRNKVIDEDFLNYKLSHEYIPYNGNEYLYNNINLKNALEFVDLVFDNNVDKMYFLRQYLKNFQDNYGIKTAVKAKRFVK